MSWNKALDFFETVKDEYIKNFPNVAFDDLYKSDSLKVKELHQKEIDEYTLKYSDMNNIPTDMERNYISAVKNCSTCFERWIIELYDKNPEKYKDYINIIANLKCTQYGDLLSLKYNLVNVCSIGNVNDVWNLYDGLFRECRGVVMDMRDDGLVLTPFKKFFNINELNETSMAEIEEKMNHAKVIEFSNKLDGSMQSARWYHGQVVMAGSSALDPECSYQLKNGYKFIHDKVGYAEMLQDYPDYTFIFEYISMDDPHVVKYKKDEEGLYLIGIRDVNTGEESDYKTVLKFASRYDILTTQTYKKTLKKVMTELDDKKSSEAEGFVINIDGYRVKLKYNDYVQVHKVLSKLASENVIVQVIADGKWDDLIAKIPEAYQNIVKEKGQLVWDYIDSVMNRTNKYVMEALTTVSVENVSTKTNDDKKNFMVYINNHVPTFFKGYCRNLYLDKDINLLKRGPIGNEHYTKMHEIKEYLNTWEHRTFNGQEKTENKNILNEIHNKTNMQ